MRRTATFLVALFAFAATAEAQFNLGDLKKAVDKVREKKATLRGTETASAAGPVSSRTSDGTIGLWVERRVSGRESPLHSEVVINGQTVNIYTSDTWEPVQQYLQSGWNTIKVATTLQEPGDQDNGLIFRIGPVTKDPRNSEQIVMAPVLWQFRNYTDWQQTGNRYRHALGPSVREVTLDMKFYWAGLDDERREIDAGDFILTGRPQFTGADAPITATVFVNGHALNTFMAPERNIVITPYLKKGKNEIKIVSSRIPNIVGENDVLFAIAGPARWIASEQKYVLPPVMQFKGMQGWIRDEESGRLTSSVDPEDESVERVIPFMIKDSASPAGE